MFRAVKNPLKFLARKNETKEHKTRFVTMYKRHSYSIETLKPYAFYQSSLFQIILNAI